MILSGSLYMIRTKRNEGLCYYGQGFPCTSIPFQPGTDVTLLKLRIVGGSIVQHSLMESFCTFQRALRSWIQSTRSVRGILRREQTGQRLVMPFQWLLRQQSYTQRLGEDVKTQEV